LALYKLFYLILLLFHHTQLKAQSIWIIFLYFSSNTWTYYNILHIYTQCSLVYTMNGKHARWTGVGYPPVLFIFGWIYRSSIFQLNL
jgi:hypothetical protein